MRYETIAEKEAREKRIIAELKKATKNRPCFEYKFDFMHGELQFKPYCFRWVLAYRLKEAYLWIFSFVFVPFLRLARALQRIEEREIIDQVTLRKIRNESFKIIRLR